MKNARYLLLLLLLSTAVFGQNNHEESCALSSGTQGQRFTVRGKAYRNLHDLILVVPGCKEAAVLVYAGEIGALYGSSSTSINVPGPSEPTGVTDLKLRRDSSFNKFKKYLNATYESRGAEHCIQCPKYEVEATFTGMLELETIPKDLTRDNLGFLHDSSGKIVGQAGFGHPPSRKYRLVIESVSDVKARKIAKPGTAQSNVAAAKPSH